MEQPLVFRRFSPDKQDQIQELVNYATLLGLDGRDLVSIGNKLIRTAKSQERDQNRRLISTLNPMRIGQKFPISSQFKLQNSTGVWYYFYLDGWYTPTGAWNIKNSETKTKLFHVASENYEFGSCSMRVQYFNNILMDIVRGELKLNF